MKMMPPLTIVRKVLKAEVLVDEVYNFHCMYILRVYIYRFVNRSPVQLILQ